MPQRGPGRLPAQRRRRDHGRRRPRQWQAGEPPAAITKLPNAPPKAVPRLNDAMFKPAAAAVDAGT
ncbi:hypothetical protein WJ973_21965 [Achromobacter xylosoxidans]